MKHETADYFVLYHRGVLVHGVGYYGSSTMVLKNCQIRYNPFTGQKITGADKSVLMKQGVFIGGGCGATPSEISLASVQGKKATSKDQFDKLKELLANQ